MSRFIQDVFIASGLRTPFGRGGGALMNYDAIGLSVPLVKAMAEQLDNQRPDLEIFPNPIRTHGVARPSLRAARDQGIAPDRTFCPKTSRESVNRKGR